MHSIVGVFALTALSYFASGVQATFFLDTCPTDLQCCQTAPKRSLLRRTDTCPAGTPKQCCQETQQVVKLYTQTVLQCGKKAEKTSTVTVTVENCPASSTDECIHVAYANVATTTFSEVHLQLSSVPITSSAPGKFSFNNYCSVAAGGATADCWVPLSIIISDVFKPASPSTFTLCDQTLYIAAHAAISDGNTCWGVGPGIVDQTKNWAMNFPATFTCVTECTKQCCCPIPTPQKFCALGTGFAQNPACPSDGSGTCTYWLKNLGCGANRWGWWFSFPAPAATLTYPLIVGAGLNDVSHGTDVGSVSIAPASATAVDVTYSLDAGYEINVAHIWLSCTPIPPKTAPPTSATNGCSPGLYTFNSGCLAGADRKTFTKRFDLGCTTYYAIFHAAVAKAVDATDSCVAVDCSFTDAA